MRKSILLMTTVLLSSKLFSDYANPENYENRVKINFFGIMYEDLKKDDIYASAGLHVNPITDSFAITGRIGRNIKLDEKNTITPFGTTIFAQVHSRAYGWIGGGVKYNHNISDSFSVGAVLEGAISPGRNIPVITALEIPATFHVGQQKNYEIEVRPSIGVKFIEKKTRNNNGISVGFGYRL